MPDTPNMPAACEERDLKGLPGDLLTSPAHLAPRWPKMYPCAPAVTCPFNVRTRTLNTKLYTHTSALLTCRDCALRSLTTTAPCAYHHPGGATECVFGSSHCPFRGLLGARWFWWYDKHFVGRSRTETTCEAPRFSFTVPNHVYCPTSTAPTLRFDLKIRRLHPVPLR